MANNNNARNSSLSTTNSPFSLKQQADAKATIEGGGFDMATVADVSVKVLVAAAAGTIIYNQFASSDKTSK